MSIVEAIEEGNLKKDEVLNDNEDFLYDLNDESDFALTTLLEKAEFAILYELKQNDLINEENIIKEDLQDLSN